MERNYVVSRAYLDTAGRSAVTSVDYLDGLGRAVLSCSFGLVDDLVITRSGDRILKVDDKAVSLAYSGSFDFRKGDGGIYGYDSRGALVRDPDRGFCVLRSQSHGYPID